MIVGKSRLPSNDINEIPLLFTREPTSLDTADNTDFQDKLCNEQSVDIWEYQFFEIIYPATTTDDYLGSTLTDFR